MILVGQKLEADHASPIFSKVKFSQADFYLACDAADALGTWRILIITSHENG